MSQQPSIITATDAKDILQQVRDASESVKAKALHEARDKLRACNLDRKDPLLGFYGTLCGVKFKHLHLSLTETEEEARSRALAESGEHDNPKARKAAQSRLMDFYLTDDDDAKRKLEQHFISISEQIDLDVFKFMSRKLPDDVVAHIASGMRVRTMEESKADDPQVRKGAQFTLVNGYEGVDDDEKREIEQHFVSIRDWVDFNVFGALSRKLPRDVTIEVAVGLRKKLADKKNGNGGDYENYEMATFYRVCEVFGEGEEIECLLWWREDFGDDLPKAIEKRLIGENT